MPFHCQLFSRRLPLRLPTGAGGTIILYLPAALRRALALGFKPPVGVYVVKGDVHINGIATQTGTVAVDTDAPFHPAAEPGRGSLQQPIHFVLDSLFPFHYKPPQFSREDP